MARTSYAVSMVIGTAVLLNVECEMTANPRENVYNQMRDSGPKLLPPGNGQGDGEINAQTRL